MVDFVRFIADESQAMPFYKGMHWGFGGSKALFYCIDSISECFGKDF